MQISGKPLRISSLCRHRVQTIAYPFQGPTHLVVQAAITLAPCCLRFTRSGSKSISAGLTSPLAF